MLFQVFLTRFASSGFVVPDPDPLTSGSLFPYFAGANDPKYAAIETRSSSVSFSTGFFIS